MFRVFIKGLESIPLITTKEGAISLIESFGKDKKFIDEIKRTKNLVSFKNDYISVEEDEISQVSEENEKNLDKDNVVKMKALEEEAKEKALKEFANAATTPSGLKYIVLQEGTGNKPVATSNVKVHYTGMFLDGKVFDSSYPRKKPIEFPLGRGNVIEGWDEGIALLQVGDKARFVIPSHLGYGSRGAGGVIPPNATLIFDVELMDVK